MEVSGQLHALATLPPGKWTQYPLDRRLGGLRSLSVCCGGKKNPCRCRELKLGLVRSLVTILTELQRLTYVPKMHSKTVFHLRLGLLNCFFPFRSSDQNFICISHLSRACYVLYPSNPPWLHHPNNT